MYRVGYEVILYIISGAWTWLDSVCALSMGFFSDLCRLHIYTRRWRQVNLFEWIIASLNHSFKPICSKALIHDQLLNHSYVNKPPYLFHSSYILRFYCTLQIENFYQNVRTLIPAIIILFSNILLHLGVLHCKVFHIQVTAVKKKCLLGNDHEDDRSRKNKWIKNICPL